MKILNLQFIMKTFVSCLLIFATDINLVKNMFVTEKNMIFSKMANYISRELTIKLFILFFYILFPHLYGS